MENNIEESNQIQIELSEEVAQGIYSNLAIISHSSSEFVVDFIRVVPGVPKAKVKSRIILTPEHAKRLLFALNLKSASKKLKEVVGVDFILFLHFSIQSNINTLAFE